MGFEMNIFGGTNKMNLIKQQEERISRMENNILQIYDIIKKIEDRELTNITEIKEKIGELKYVIGGHITNTQNRKGYSDRGLL